MATDTRLSVTTKGKKETKLPPASSIISRSDRVEVEEIENGYLITKSSDIEYKVKDGATSWMYITKRWYSKDEPMFFKDKNKTLADFLEGE